MTIMEIMSMQFHFKENLLKQLLKHIETSELSIKSKLNLSIFDLL